MKLVEILAKELKEWPINTDSIWQDYDRELRFHGDRDTSLSNFYMSELCDDCLRKKCDSTPKNRVTKEMWEAEKAKQNSLSTVASDDELWGDVKEMYTKEKEVFNPIYCRDRIKEIDSLVESLEEERVSLVQSLEDEGFVLVSTALVSASPTEDMSDWRNWKEGDLVEVIGSEGGHQFFVGDIVRIKELFDEDGRCGCCEYTDHRDYWFLNAPAVKFHSRPTTVNH